MINLEQFGAFFIGFIVGVPLGVLAMWLWTEITDGELRQAHHVRESDKLDEFEEGLK